MSSSAFAKRERERIKREKAQRKEERIGARRAEAAEAAASGDVGEPERDQADILAALQKLHEALENETIDFDTFETAKAELMEQLRV
jgi:hypothetical protein